MKLKLGNSVLPQLKSLMKTFIIQDRTQALSLIRTTIIQITPSNSLDHLTFLLEMVEIIISNALDYLMDGGLQVSGLLSLPLVLRNLFGRHECMNSYEKSYYNQIISLFLKNLDQFKIEDGRFILDRLVRQGHTQLVCQLILMEMGRLQKLITTLGDSLHRNKVLECLFLMALQMKNNEAMGVILGSYDLNQRILFICKNIIMNPLLPIDSHQSIMRAICTNEVHQPCILNLLVKWSNPDFVKFASKVTQINSTNFLACLLSSLPRGQAPSQTIIKLLNDGVQQRLNFFQAYSYIRQCGEVLWRHFEELLDLKREPTNEVLEYPEFVRWDDQVEQKVIVQVADEEEEEQETIKNVNDDQEDEFNDYEFTLQDENEAGVPRNLFDCLSALQSQSSDRIASALKHLPYLIRKRLTDLHVHASDLVHLLLRIRGNDEWRDEFEESRKRILVSLLIMETVKTSSEAISRFYSDQCSLGDRHVILSLIIDGVNELSSNPSRYPVEDYNQYPTNQTFYFQKIETKYYSIEEKESKEIADTQRKERIEKKSRRWGDTLRQSKTKELKSISRQDLVIYKSNNDDQTYNNRFNHFVNEIFFPIIIPASSKLKYLLNREPLLLTQFFQMVTKLLDCAKFSFDFYKMVEESADFCITFRANKNLQVLRAKLQMWLKISCLMKKDLLAQHPLLVEKVLRILDDLNSHDLREMHDQHTKSVQSIIFENFRKLFQIELK